MSLAVILGSAAQAAGLRQANSTTSAHDEHIRGTRHHTAAPVRWHGGPLQHHPRVYLVFWGPLWGADAVHQKVRASEEAVIRGIDRSPYSQILTQYYDNHGHVGNDVTLAGVWLDAAAPRGDVSRNSALAGEAARATRVNKWVTTADTQFIILTQRGSQGALQDWCGFHDYANSGGHRYIFSLVPFLEPYGARSQCGGPDLTRAMTTTTTHEFAETVTDPINRGWYGVDGGDEIGDRCDRGAVVRGVWVQQIWSAHTRRCTAG
ncbi:MAG: hypothetical protein ACR2GX_00115 [Candidatus Dormibacteria bacterium]